MRSGVPVASRNIDYHRGALWEEYSDEVVAVVCWVARKYYAQWPTLQELTKTNKL